MTTNEREQIRLVIGILTTIEYVVCKPSGAGEAVSDANDILKALLGENV